MNLLISILAVAFTLPLTLLHTMAASLTNTLRFTWQGSGGDTLVGEAVHTVGTLAAGEEIKIDAIVQAGATDYFTDCDVNDETKIKCLYIKSDQDVTLETNNSGGVDQIDVKKDCPYVWSSLSGITNPFTSIITGLYWTNTGNSDATVKLRLLRVPSV